MIAASALAPLSLPPTRDLIGVLPELVLGGAFVVLMLADLVVPERRRSWLAVLSLLGLAGAFAVSVWGWFDAGHGRTVYSGSIAYDRYAMFVNGILLVSAALVVMISPQYL